MSAEDIKNEIEKVIVEVLENIDEINIKSSGYDYEFDGPDYFEDRVEIEVFRRGAESGAPWKIGMVTISLSDIDEDNFYAADEEDYWSDESYGDDEAYDEDEDDE